MSLEQLRYPPSEQENYDELPIGFYFPWEKSMQSTLPAWFVECNGQLLNDSDSPLDGEYIPNLNGISKSKSATLDGTTSVTVDTTKDLYAGADVSGSSIPTGAKILTIDSDTEFTLNQAATGSGTETLTIGGNGPVFLGGYPSSGIWKADQMQRISGTFDNFGGDGDDPAQTSGAFTSYAGDPNTGWDKTVASGQAMKRVSFNSANSLAEGGARTGDETYPKHRGITYVMKIKYSGKVKLITGFNVTGEEFGTFSEAGVTVKPTDRLAVFDPNGSIYKNVYAHRLRYSQPETISSTPYTIQTDDPAELLVNLSSGTVNLPEATGSGREIKLTKIHSTQGDITISPNGSDTIEGESSDVIKSQYAYIILKDIASGLWQLIDCKDEGEFTPELSFGGGTTGITYSNRYGSYARNKKLLTFDLSIYLTNRGSSTGLMAITGLPFSPENQTPISWYQSKASVITDEDKTALINTSGEAYLIHIIHASSSSRYQLTDFLNDAVIVMSGTFIIG
jgi:hypothetical protein